MTSPVVVSPARRMVVFLGSRGQDILLVSILCFVLLSGYAGAFQHMHDWTMDEVPKSHEWQGWANAIISELMPAAAYLLIGKRQRVGRDITGPRLLLIGSVGLSLCAQLSATGLRFPGDKYVLACLPLLAVLILGEMILSDGAKTRKAKEARAELERKAAEQARLAAELKAEQAAELAAEQARRDAELAAELERQQAERAERVAADAAERAERLAAQQAQQEAARAVRLAEIEQVEMTKRERLAADERRAEREARLEIEREAALAEAAGRAEAERLRAEAEADARRVEAAAAAALAAAETARLETETKIREQAVSRLNGRHRAVGEGSGHVTPPANVADLDESRRQRRPKEETAAMIDAIVSALPSGTARADAVKIAADRLGFAERYVRKFLPEDWTVGSSVVAAA